MILILCDDIPSDNILISAFLGGAVHFLLSTDMQYIRYINEINFCWKNRILILWPKA